MIKYDAKICIGYGNEFVLLRMSDEMSSLFCTPDCESEHSIFNPELLKPEKQIPAEE